MRVSEVYASTQGEGPNVGRTTVFTRFGGCNLRCPGWPCDTIHAIDPKYRHEWDKLTPTVLGERVIGEAERVGAKFVTLTGGEPFLQQDEELEDFTLLLVRKGYQVDCFSNGTIEYPDWALSNIRFIMDWKLTGSGERFFGPKNAQRIENLYRLATSQREQSVKFVIKNRADYEEAKDIYSNFEHEFKWLNVYYGAVWGEIETHDLVDWVLTDKLPWLVNVQVHNYIWDRDERGR